ncbi:heat shock 70 kda protein cognate [Anaeramoeba flamelloides]|uniref:Heat shock 70 kDa protein cognate n=1 Tax=Anaeramoeba flamelloides TaxID=1746091 RepID=A0AAV8A277_9EUKA|nr:heat shock 70 kda protein cognate [Anaeramoeba flamelloides]
MTSPIIGIDLGTTYSCVGVWKNDRVEIIANEMGNRTTPSCVAFTEEERLIGESSLSQMGWNPKNTIYDVKRIIGRKFSDQSLQDDLVKWSFKVFSKTGDKTTIQVQFKNKTVEFAPEEISAMILSKMKETAENFLGNKIQKAVVTVPAYFNDLQRSCTKDAGAIAGLNVVRILNEPTAAAIAYGLDHKDEEGEKTVLVYDLGGGTFDVSLLTIEKGVIEVKATAGDTHLGGEDFDNTLVDYCIEDFKRKNRFLKEEITENVRSMRRLQIACEKAKRLLSNSSFASITVDALFQGIDYRTAISRARFEELCGPLFRTTIDPIDRVLRDAKITKEQVDEIVLVGGSTRIPRIQELLKKYFKGKELNKTINPDEAVAYGAAVQGVILSGLNKKPLDLVLVDVTPLSLGIETAGGLMANIIPRNSSIPIEKSQVFTTYQDNQTTVKIQIFEGERPNTVNNTLLGQFKLVGITPQPRWTPRIRITFSVDSNGILDVTAKEFRSNISKNIVIQNGKGRLTHKQIEQMIKDADLFHEEDLKVKETIKSRNYLETYCFGIKRSLRNLDENQQQITEKEKKEIIDLCNETLSWIDKQTNPTKEKFEKKLNDVQSFCEPILFRTIQQNTNNENQDDVEDIGIDQVEEELEIKKENDDENQSIKERGKETEEEKEIKKEGENGNENDLFQEKETEKEKINQNENKNEIEINKEKI